MPSHSTTFCHVDVHTPSESVVRLVGLVDEKVRNDTIRYASAAPPTRGSSFSGSGLPFANMEQAFDNSPNTGHVKVDGMHRFELSLQMPNSYYVGLGTVLVPPTVFLEYTNSAGVERRVAVKVSDGIPYRMLTFPMSFTKARSSCLFYDGTWELPVRTQEQILRSSAYPDVDRMHPNFWGDKPRN